MKTNTERTWPIATITAGPTVLIGLPQRLGSGQLPTRETYDLFPPIEAVAGTDWVAQILAALLPRTLAWAWWTPSRAAGLRRLAPGHMSAVISLTSLDRVVGRSWLWRGMTLAIVPPMRTDSQNLVLEWAGIDTEHTPEFVLTAPSSLVSWDSTVISAWCIDRSAWGDPNSVATLPAERLIVLFDGEVYCAVPSDHAAEALQSLHDLAKQWGLRVIPGPAEIAWPTPSGG